MIETYSDRSRLITFQECHRKRWLQYQLPNGTEVPGIIPLRVNGDLLIGSGFHEGVNALLTGVGEDEAVGRALEGYRKWPGVWSLIKGAGLAIEEGEDLGYVAYELASMVEALVRAYGKVILPGLLNRFIVVEAEKDEAATFEIPGIVKVRWGARTDALLMEKESLDLYILSLKTKKEWKGKKDEDTNRYDVQGMSETATVDQRLQGWANRLNVQGWANRLNVPHPLDVPEWFRLRHKEGNAPQVLGVKMEFAIKGKKYPRQGGGWGYSNPLIRPWKKADDLGGGNYAWRYEFQDPMGGNHRLGKGWNRINIWEDMGVKEWIEKLASEEIQGMPAGSALEASFVLPSEYFRKEEYIEGWVKEMLYQEERVARGTEEVLRTQGVDTTPKMLQESFLDALREHFPKHSNYPTSCVYCEYEEVCHGPGVYIHDPMSLGVFRPREANHEAEGEGNEHV